MKPGKHLKNPDGTCSENCYPCRLKTVSFAASAMITRSPVAARAARTDPELGKDREAYKRLRKNGEQPKQVKGSAHLESTANESVEITTGRIIPDQADRKQFASAFAEMPDPSSKPIVREPA